MAGRHWRWEAFLVRHVCGFFFLGRGLSIANVALHGVLLLFIKGDRQGQGLTREDSVGSLHSMYCSFDRYEMEVRFGFGVHITESCSFGDLVPGSGVVSIGLKVWVGRGGKIDRYIAN